MADDTAAGAKAPPSAYVYATTLERDRSRFTLGLPRFTPPSRAAGWEVCGVSYVREGLIVSWRCPSPIATAVERPAS